MKTMPKKKLALALSVLLAFAVLLLGAAACGEEETTSSSAAVSEMSPSSTSGGSTTATSATSSEKTLVIGQITSISGPMSATFKNEADAAKPVEDFINARGGVTVGADHYMIKIVTEDDMSTQDGAIAAANKLLGQGIKFLLMPHFLPNMLAISPVLEEAKVLRVVPDTISSQPAAPPNKYSFIIRLTGYQLQASHDTLLKCYPDVKKVAIIAPDDPGIAPLTDTVRKDLEERLSLQVVFREDYPLDTQDFAPLVTKALAADPDVIGLTTGAPQWGKGIVEAARQMGFTGPVLASAPMGDVGILNSLLKPEIANDIVVGACPYVKSPDMPQLAKDFGEVIESAGLDYNLDHANILNSVHVLLQGITEAQSLDVESVAAAMESMDAIDTAFGQDAKFIGAESFAGVEGIGQNRMLLYKDVPVCRIMGGNITMEWVPSPTR